MAAKNAAKPAERGWCGALVEHGEGFGLFLMLSVLERTTLYQSKARYRAQYFLKVIGIITL
jgi:hypothetical protein